MNNLQVFENKEFGNVRVVEISNQVWFIAKDICEALDLTNPTVAVDRLDDDERTKFNLGRQGRANVVNEYGLYNLVLSSRKKSAKKFKRWITHEVIPSIRKHGAYMTPEAIEKTLTDPDFIIGLANRLKDEQKKTKALETKIEKDKPKIYFANEVSTSNTTILVGEMAKLLNQTGIDIGQNRFYEWLRKNGYVVRRKGQDYNLPTQKSMDLGIMRIKENTIIKRGDTTMITKTTMITGKGQRYFMGKFRKMQEEEQNAS